jgi:DNA repair exonuclease SbcCD ATPase subunit
LFRQLTLKNWRIYDNITVEFAPGTTFVVASNGVGKTSLVEAARWALFGIAPAGNNAAIRAGADEAVATVELELPDKRILRVERTLASKPRTSRVPPVVHLDKELVSDSNLSEQLTAAYKTEPGFLARLTMPTVDLEDNQPSKLGLEEHLGRYYGIDGLRRAVDRLKGMIKDTETRIRQIKAVNATSSQLLTQLQNDVEQAAQRVAEATERHKTLQRRLDSARERERLTAAAEKWQADQIAWTRATEDLAARVSKDLGRPITPANLHGTLSELLAELDEKLETVRVDIGVRLATEAALRANQGRLHEAHDDCPICRRPLDATTIEFAHEANRRDLADIEVSVRDLRMAEEDLTAKRARLKDAEAHWRQLSPPGEPPSVPDIDDAGMTSSELTMLTETALSTLVEVRAAHVQATREFDDARKANEAMRELESLFRHQASLRVAVATTESTLTELLDDTIHPLAVEVDQRWKALFPARGDLNTASDGNITRTVNGHPLPYDAFSTGESMGATILLRLLVAQMATDADFCWFDEPLEHLDPDVRRKVANLLSRVTAGGGPLRQVVVTTYEEPLARHLQARDPQHVRLLGVRQEGR